jgi:nucleoside-diphosphate-sugar epimerase
MLIGASGLDVSVKEDQSLMRLGDEPLLLANISRLKALGWKQEFTFQETLNAVFEDWLARSNV